MTANDARKRTEEARKRSYWLFDEVMTAIERAASNGDYNTSVEIYSPSKEDINELVKDLGDDGYKVDYWSNTNVLTINWA
jgi:hypothetical protein